MIFLGSTAVVTAKIAGIVASSYVAWTAYNSTPENELRRNIHKAFKAGKLGLKVQRGSGKNKREVILYPKVQRVTSSLERKQVVFTVPTGMNPKEVYDHDWLFRQVFGEHIELNGDVKTFALNVYREGIKEFDYDAAEVKKTIKEMRLPIFVGRCRAGAGAYDMTEHPHLLIAGETGAGKSVQVRSILTTLVVHHRPKFELYCADLKMSEFHLFHGVADEVVYNAEGLHVILTHVKKELNKRGLLLNKMRLANISELPEGVRPKYIILAIDEVALLQKHPACMDIIEEISAIGRALGVFLVLSMQRPDADVLDGKLKNNLTVRMAFRHSDEINSRITIGSGEAAHIKPTQKGLMVHKLDGIMFVQAPHLKLDSARELLKPFTLDDDGIQHRDEQKAQERQEEGDSMELGGLEE